MLLDDELELILALTIKKRDFFFLLKEEILQLQIIIIININIDFKYVYSETLNTRNTTTTKTITTEINIKFQFVILILTKQQNKIRPRLHTILFSKVNYLFNFRIE